MIIWLAALAVATGAICGYWFRAPAALAGSIGMMGLAAVGSSGSGTLAMLLNAAASLAAFQFTYLAVVMLTSQRDGRALHRSSTQWCVARRS